MYQHGTEYFIALAGDLRMVAFEGIRVPCTRVYYANSQGDIISYVPIIKMLGTIDVALAITTLEERLMVVDEEREKASQLIRTTLKHLEKDSEGDLHDVLETAAQLYYELCKRSLALHSIE